MEFRGWFVHFVWFFCCRLKFLSKKITLQIGSRYEVFALMAFLVLVNCGLHWLGFVMCRHCLIHCHQRTTRMGIWCWEAMAVTSTKKLHRWDFVVIDKSHGLNLCPCCVGSHENWKTQAHFFRNADNYQNCCWEWCWKNSGWQVSNSIGFYYWAIWIFFKARTRRQWKCYLRAIPFSPIVQLSSFFAAVKGLLLCYLTQINLHPLFDSALRNMKLFCLHIFISKSYM